MRPQLDSGLSNFYFGAFALAALLCSFGVLLSKHPLNATINLIGTMLAISGIYAILGSPFLGVVQILVYAGAIMMLVVFVIMVLNRARDHEVPLFDRWSAPVAAIPLLLLATFANALRDSQLASDAGALRGDIEPIASRMFAMQSGYWLLFELIGLVLLVAIVGAVLLAKRSLVTPVHPASIAEEAHGSH